MKSARRTGVFVSYSHKDVRWLQRLQVHLAPYVRRGDLNLWDDTKIQAGELWQPAIQSAIERAAAFVLLVSADFLASEFIVSKELPRVLDKARNNGARVLSIVVRPCKLEAHPAIASYQTLTPPDKPLSRLRLSKAEERLAEAAEAIARLLGTTTVGAAAAASQDADDDSDGQLFREMESATILLSVLHALAGGQGRIPEGTVSDVMRALDIRSRKLGVEALERLLAAGWIEKHRVDNTHTRFAATSRGVRQLQLLSAASDGPLRRAR
jgi:hypothetical protein